MPEPQSLLPVQLANGGVIYLSPGSILAKEQKTKAHRRAFFEEWNASISGKRGTTFTTGVETQRVVGAGALEKPRQTPNFGFLRQMRHQSPIDQSIINIRLAQVKHVARRCVNSRRQAGWRVRHMYADDPRFENTDDILRRCTEMEAFVSKSFNPAWHPFGFRSVLLNLAEDELVLDRKVIVYDGLDRRGRPTGYHLLAGETVLPRIDAILPELDRLAAERKVSVTSLMADPETVGEATERLSEAYGVDLVDAAYVQILEGRIAAAWRADEIAVDVVNTTTEINRWGFGTSALESSLWWSLAFLLAANYNRDLFEQNYPESIMFLFGDYDPEGLEAFKKQVLGESQAGNNFRIPIIPGGDPQSMNARIEKVRENPKDMMFGAWLKMLTSYKAANYRMNPELLNFDLVHGSDQTLFQSEAGEARVTLSREEGFNSLLYSCDDFITRALVEPYYDDLVFEHIGLDSMTEARETEMLSTQMMWSKPNEIRAKTGSLGPLTGPDAALGEMLLTPTALQYHALELQEQELKQNAVLARQQLAQKAEAPPSAGGRLHHGQSKPSKPKSKSKPRSV